ncbi:MAG: acetoacetate decarboxylase family protein [Candidatus Dadabacteria bacterium]|nr:acetoacetate decarboxylase family protein [Candidatus Dadabacteria bacterium]NIS07711.1 acetoacetate decarboxylase family protein [Candidatus Dadabacteria bacterium]NIV42290.1 hypothetical protein [Candidatus Dadabacteria bacterium]NIX14797.1 hypothetical protein [Candidatus Dadabacteria bacterium]NIY21338.1 hypothetical protein [Candidatus Dadabacteria bacterium]
MRVSKFLVLFFVLCIASAGSFVRADEHEMKKEAKMMELPGPQLVTDAWMFITAYKADPAVLKSLLPKGLESTGNIVMNMYTVPTAEQTSGFGAYTLTYLTVEIKDHDSYVMNSDITYPGRYFVHYYNSSPIMRAFTKKVGIPAQQGLTTTTVKDGKLTATLHIDGKPVITSTADVGTELGGFGGGHLNYFGLIKAEKDGKKVNQVVKYPIPFNGGSVETKNVKIAFSAPEGHSLNKVKPIAAEPVWAVWMKGSFVYPQHQVINEF